MTDLSPQTVLCITSYDKGQEFLRECKRQGWHVILLDEYTLRFAKDFSAVLPPLQNRPPSRDR